MSMPGRITTNPRGRLWQIPLACHFYTSFLLLEGEGEGRAPSLSSNPVVLLSVAKNLKRGRA